MTIQAQVSVYPQVFVPRDKYLSKVLHNTQKRGIVHHLADEAPPPVVRLS
jgi:hypothetical protein